MIGDNLAFKVRDGRRTRLWKDGAEMSGWTFLSSLF